MLLEGDNDVKKNKHKKRKETNGKSIGQDDRTVAQIDEEALSRAIVSAYREIQEQKKKDEAAQAEKEKCEWDDILGQIDYPTDEKWYKARIHEMRNIWVAFWKIVFMKSDDVKDLRATFVLIGVLTTCFFNMCRGALCIFAVCIIITVLMGKTEWTMGLPYAFSAWVLARIFRIVAIEISKLKDGNLLLAIFSGCLSLVAVVIAIIALVVG